MSHLSLEIQQAAAHYDDTTRLVRIVYHGELGAEVTRQVYDWLEELYEAVGTDAIYGQIFDFRKVTQFLDENLQAARRASKIANIRMDTSRFPVALLISDFYHQEILRSAMRVTPDNERKRLVWSEAEALEFFQQWHLTNVAPLE